MPVLGNIKPVIISELIPILSKVFGICYLLSRRAYELSASYIS